MSELLKPSVVGLIETADTLLADPKQIVQRKTGIGPEIRVVTLKLENGALAQIRRREIESHKAGDLWIYTLRPTQDESGRTKLTPSMKEFPRDISAVNDRNLHHLIAGKPEDEINAMPAEFNTLRQQLATAERVPDKDFLPYWQTPSEQSSSRLIDAAKSNVVKLFDKTHLRRPGRIRTPEASAA